MADADPITTDLVDEIAVLRARLAMLERQAESVTETERALRESKVRLRSIVGHAPIVLFALDCTGVITLSEGKGLESLGLKPGQVVGQSAFDLYAEDEHICDTLRRALRGESFSDCADVGDTFFETRFTPLLDKEGEPNGCIGVAMDVTQRVRAERALRSSEERFRMLAENIPGAVYLCQNDERYTMLYLNDAVERLTGYPKVDFMEDRISFVDLFHPDDADEVGSRVDEAIATRKPFHLNYRIKHKDGHLVWVEESGVGVFRNDKLAFLEGYLADITNRKEAELALQEAHDRLEARVEERTEELSRTNRGLAIEMAKREATAEELRRERDLLQTLMDHMPDYVFVKDRESRFITANRAQLHNLNVSDVSQIAGKRDNDFSQKEFAEHYLADDQKVIQSAEPIFNIAEDGLGADGSKRRLLTTKVPLLDEHGEVAGLVGIARDVTELQAAQDEVAKTKHMLAHVLRVATVGEMASGLAHELNNPLSAITNFIRGCERRMDAGDLKNTDLRDVLEQIKLQADRASGIVKTMRRHVSPRDVQREPSQVNDVIREAVQLVSSDLHDRQIHVALDLQEYLPKAAFNRVQVEQVMLNLLLNAMEAIDSVEDIDDEKKSSRAIAVQSRSVEDMIEVTVQDTGPGFDSKQSDRYFEAFVTTKQDGLGMGLSISRSIIESHGGRLWVEPRPSTAGSRKGEPCGAVVRFRLPAQRETS